MGDPLKAKLFMRPDSPCSTVSGYTNRDSEVGSMMSDDMGYSLTIDQDLSRMENLLDQWTGDIKRNVLVSIWGSINKCIGHSICTMHSEHLDLIYIYIYIYYIYIDIYAVDFIDASYMSVSHFKSTCCELFQIFGRCTQIIFTYLGNGKSGHFWSVFLQIIMNFFQYKYIICTRGESLETYSISDLIILIDESTYQCIPVVHTTVHVILYSIFVNQC